MAAGMAAMMALGAVLAAAPPKAKHKAATPTPPALPPARTVSIPIACADALGQGVKTGRVFCEVTVSHDPTRGDLIVVPKHEGTAVVRFHLHNRQIVSPSLIRSKRAYTRATATVVVVRADGTILGRGTVQTEFRREADLLDRVAAGAGATGYKAVAPIGDELISIAAPEAAESVTVVGERLALTQIDGSQTLTSDGSPVAFISSAQVEYHAPPAKPPEKSTAKKSKASAKKKVTPHKH
jgi:hypothetical protein